MSRLFIIAIMFSLLVIGSCNKETQQSPSVNNSTNNTTATIDSSHKVKTAKCNGDIFSFTYDTLGRVISIVGPYSTTTYTYHQSSVTALKVTPFLTDSIVYTLNSQGLAMSDNIGNTYTYDADGYHVSTIYSGGQSYDSLYILNGDLIDSVHVNTATNTRIEFGATYTTQKETRDFGMAFLGKTNTHLINIGPPNISWGNSNVSAHYIFEFDGQNRVIQEIKAYRPTSAIINEFSYY